MFRKQIYYLSAALLIILIFTGASYIYEYLTKPKTLTAKDLGFDFKTIKSASEFQIKQGEKLLLKFKKVSGGWEVNGKTADSEKIKNFLESLSSPVIESELGSIKGRERDFSLDRLSRYEVEIISNSKKQVIYFGKVGPVLHSRYLQIPGKDRVYLVSGSFTDDLSNTSKDWREKKLISINLVKTVSVETTSSSFQILFKGQSAVINSSGKNLKLTGSDAEPLKLDLEGVKADDFVDNPDAKTLELLKKPEIKVTVELKNGKSYVLTFKRKDSDYFICRKEGVDWLFLVPFFNLDVFTSDPLKNYGGANR